LEGRSDWLAAIFAPENGAVATPLRGIGAPVSDKILLIKRRLSAPLLVAAVLGGRRHFLGPVLAALAVVGLDEIALRFALYHGLISGLLLAVVGSHCPRLGPDLDVENARPI
jgi:ABC-type branched-subunit amino acid transport system permease subunit